MALPYEITLNSLISIGLFVIFSVISYIISRILSFFIYRLIEEYGLPEFLEKYKFKEAAFGIDLVNLIKILSFWYFFLAGLTISAYYSNLKSLFLFFSQYLVPYFYKATYGVVVILVGFWLSYLVKSAIENEKFAFSSILARLIYYVMIYMIITSVLPYFGIDNKIFLDVFKYFILGISFGIGMALGIGFGLALKKRLEEELEKIKF